MPYACSEYKTAVINLELFVLRGYSQNNSYDKSVRKFCNKPKTWFCETQLLLDTTVFVFLPSRKFYIYFMERVFVFITILN